jgi:hypothetical protein
MMQSCPADPQQSRIVESSNSVFTLNRRRLAILAGAAACAAIDASAIGAPGAAGVAELAFARLAAHDIACNTQLKAI